MRTASSLLAVAALFVIVQAADAQTPTPAPAAPAALPEPTATPAKRHSHRKAADPAASPTPAGAPATSSPEVSPGPTATPSRSHRRKQAVADPAATPATPAAPAATPLPAGAPPAAAPAPAPATGAQHGPPKLDPNATPAPGGGPGMVWVNTKSHVFHASTSRYYGKTKAGKYMTEQAALAEGDHAAPPRRIAGGLPTAGLVQACPRGIFAGAAARDPAGRTAAAPALSPGFAALARGGSGALPEREPRCMFSSADVPRAREPSPE